MAVPFIGVGSHYRACYTYEKAKIRVLVGTLILGIKLVGHDVQGGPSRGVFRQIDFVVDLRDENDFGIFLDPGGD